MKVKSYQVTKKIHKFLHMLVKSINNSIKYKNNNIDNIVRCPIIPVHIVLAIMLRLCKVHSYKINI